MTAMKAFYGTLWAIRLYVDLLGSRPEILLLASQQVTVPYPCASRVERRPQAGQPGGQTTKQMRLSRFVHGVDHDSRVGVSAH